MSHACASNYYVCETPVHIELSWLGCFVGEEYSLMTTLRVLCLVTVCRHGAQLQLQLSVFSSRFMLCLLSGSMARDRQAGSCLEALPHE